MSTYLITGGTGTFGFACTQELLRRNIDRVLVLSRDEVKQSEMRKAIPDPRLEFRLRDVRDLDGLRLAFRDVDIVIHAAALKQVPKCEYEPFEAVQTNVLGSMHVIQAALDCGVTRVLALSSDKAAAALNTYGKTKALAEALFVRANSYAGPRRTRFALVRYGNVIGSRGSVIPLFQQQRRTGVVTLTDARMTRFWIAIEEAVQFCLARLDFQGGEIFVPKLPSATMADLGKAIAPACEIREVGRRPGEKLHEVLITEHEAAHTYDCGDRYLIAPVEPSWPWRLPAGACAVPDGWSYRSDGDPLPVQFVEVEAQ